jgi:hypothetical protein
MASGILGGVVDLSVLCKRSQILRGDVMPHMSAVRIDHRFRECPRWERLLPGGYLPTDGQMLARGGVKGITGERPFWSLAEVRN